MPEYRIDDEIQEESLEPRGQLRRLIYALGLLLFILILLFNMTGLSHWFIAGQLSKDDLRGETEAEIVSRLGEPDFRSPVQPFIPGHGIGMVPQHLEAGEEFFYLDYIIGPRLYVFHFVSPDTFSKHTGQIVLGDEWIVLEHYSGSRYVVY